MGIKRTSKLWTHAGAAALITGLAACSEPVDTNEAETPAAATSPSENPAPSYSGGEGEGEGSSGGESGGGGEFGIDPDAAAVDPVVYISALEVIRAHYIAGVDALVLGQRSAGAEMFSHGISEIYVDLEDVVIARGATNFMDLMTEASIAPFDGRSDEEVQTAVDAVLAAITAAEAYAPPSEKSETQVFAEVMASLIERAALQYQFAAAEPGASEAYLDGYGFERAAATIGARHMTAIRANDAGTANALASALDQLSAAYPTAQRPDALDADIPALLAASRAASDAVN